MSDQRKATGPGSGFELFDVMESRHTPRCQLWSDTRWGLRAVLVIDDWTLGPAAGGIRTRAYTSLAAAIDDAAQLARAMTLKCSLGGVDAGGAKVVMLEHPGLDRRAAFARLGQLVAELGGRFITAGDLGTTVGDLEVMAEHCPYVHVGEAELSDSVARGLLRCVEACAEQAGGKPVASLDMAVQGCGAIGSAVARILAREGAGLVLADVDGERARAVADEVAGLGASRVRVVEPDQVLVADVDIISPCAVGGVVTPALADQMAAWAVCGAANNIVANPEAERRMMARGILHVPDIVASAGAAIDGIGDMVMGLADRGPLIDGLGDTARALLADSQRTGQPTSELAEKRAWDRIRAKSQPTVR